MHNESASPGREGMSVRVMVRITMIVIQLILVYCFSGEFQPFFYQAF